MNYKPGTYALLAAVGNYETPELCQLPGYQEDLAAMTCALSQGLKVDRDQIRTLGEEGTVRRESFARAIAEFGSMLHKEDTFLFYFTGHGINGNLMFSDGAVTIQSIVDYVAGLTAERKIVILDCCYAGGGNIPETHILTFEDAIRAFAGKGIVLMASSAADRQAWLTEDGSRSLYTDLLSRSILSRRLIRKGKIALSDVHKEISYLTEKWNHLHPEKTQNPVYRDNLVGTIYFDVEEYRPYITNKLTFETGDYIVQSVKPLSTMTQKRLAAFVLLKDPDDTLLPSITREIAQQIRNADIYASEKSEAQLKGRSADVVWCYFGYSEEDLARGNHFAYTIWTDDEEMRKRYFRDGRNSEVLDGIYVFWNTSYEIVRNIFTSEKTEDEILKEYRQLLNQMVNRAESFIGDRNEWKNGKITDDSIKEKYGPWVKEVRNLFFKLTDADAPPPAASEWAEAVLETAGWIVDLALAMDRAETFGKENDRWLEEITIDRYYESVRKLSEIPQPVL